MKQEENDSPEWLSSSRESILNSKDNWSKIYTIGQEDIRRGIEKTRAAENEINKLNRLEIFLNSQGVEDNSSDEIVTISGSSLAGTLDYYNKATKGWYIRVADQSSAADQEHQHFIQAVSDTTSASSNAMLYIAANMEHRIIRITDTYQPILQDPTTYQDQDRDELFHKLEELISQIPDDKFLNMLLGSESALQNEAPDHLSQAAQSMRDLFDQLINFLAPNDIVRAQPWFVADDQSRSGVTRVHRLRYVLYQSGEDLYEYAIEQLDSLAEAAKRALDLVIARAHNHDPELTPIEVQDSIDHARYNLLTVLKIHFGTK